ncbi:MAG: hypothetical protein P1U46_04550 [Patescibacteria group bacterium]|nr:hypothetical protein [Patescibacteria group bacterium]
MDETMKAPKKKQRQRSRFSEKKPTDKKNNGKRDIRRKKNKRD